MSLQIIIKPSAIFAIIMSAISVGAIICVLLLQFSIFIKIMISVFVIFYMIYFFRQYIFFSNKKSIIKLNCQQKESWWLDLKTKPNLSVRLNQKVVTRYLMMLSFKETNNQKTHSLILFANNYSKKQWWQLSRLVTDL